MLLAFGMTAVQTHEHNLPGEHKQLMTQSTLVTTISDELSSEVATAILTRQTELGRDPLELLDIVMTVHNTLRELSASAGESRYQKKYRFASGSG